MNFNPVLVFKTKNVKLTGLVFSNKQLTFNEHHDDILKIECSCANGKKQCCYRNYRRAENENSKATELYFFSLI